MGMGANLVAHCGVLLLTPQADFKSALGQESPTGPAVRQPAF